jgi:DNA gyrase subunit B
LYQISRKRKREYLLHDRALNRRLADWGLAEARLVIRDPSGKEKQLTGDTLQVLMDALVRIERQGRALQRRGLALDEFVRRHLDPENGALPTIRAILDGEEHLFYSESEFAAFRSGAEERFGELKVVDARLGGEDPAQATTEGSAKVLRRSELGESTVLQEQFGRLGEFGVGVEDYFSQRKRRISGELEPARFILYSGDQETRELNNLAELVPGVRQIGSNGVQVKRYKGLGEMNADELWETTMDPERRSLIKVIISDAEQDDDPEQFEIDAREADRIFSILMGDDVEARREFIGANAASVRNLDV